jgi:hypothetical protein
MQHTLTYVSDSTPVLDSNPPFNVAIAYEDFETGKHAKRTYDLLVENIGGDWRFANQMWKFDVLLLPKLLEIAVEDAVRADIIMISSRGRELPEHVKLWIESWLPMAAGPLALVALFQHTREDLAQRNVARNYLAAVARRGNMEFFSQADVWPAGKPATNASVSEESWLTGRALSKLPGVVKCGLSSPRWTLND